MNNRTLDIWLEGTFAGKLHRGKGTEVEFVYDQDYLSLPDPTPLSISMPGEREGYGPAVVIPWLENLLPDDPVTRQGWAAHFGTTQTDAFTLLGYMGADAPGAVQVVPEGSEPNLVGQQIPLSDAQIARKVEGLIESPKDWIGESESFDKWSLGGSQSKFALALVEGKWYEPSGRAASTHIVKPGMQISVLTNAETQALEYVTMRTARLAGLSVADVELKEFAGMPTFVTQRYDRVIHSNGSVARVHQEDMCQALGVSPRLKYEEHGGPGIAQIAEILEARSYRPVQDKELFAEAIAFNLLVAGTDSHAKNYSLIHVGRNAVFAPLYDLVSAHAIYYPKSALMRASAPMTHGNTRRYNYVNADSLALTADDLRLSRDRFTDILVAVARRLSDAATQAIEELPPNLRTDKIASLSRSFAASGRHFIARAADVKTSHVSQSSHAGTVRNRLGREVPVKVWVPGHWRNGEWVFGYERGWPRVRS